jgi:hypothetical protein
MFPEQGHFYLLDQSISSNRFAKSDVSSVYEYICVIQFSREIKFIQKLVA